MKDNKRVEIFFDFLAGLLAIVYFVVLFLHIDYFKVPHGDIYQYIGDARTYARFLLPSMIQLQPLTPILMAIIRPLFSDFAFPYFATAKFINIFAASGTLVFTYLIVKKKLSAKIALLIAVLCSIHPLTLINALDITTIGLYVFFTMGALLFIDSNKKMFFIFATLAFLVRIEGFVLVIVYLLNKVNFQKNKPMIGKKNIYPLIFIIFSIVLTIFQTIHNKNQNSAPYGNQYINEAFSIPLRTENFVYVFGLLGASFFPETFVWWGMDLLNPGLTNGLLILVSISILIVGIFFKKTKSYGIYLLIMSIVHSFFPGIENRYFFLFLNLMTINTLIIFYEIYQKTKSIILKKILDLILITATIYWIAFSINQIQNNFINYREEGLDLYYDVSNWLFNSMEPGNYYIFTEKEYLYSNIFLNSKKYFNSLKNNQPIISWTDERITKVGLNDKTLNFVRLSRVIKQCTDKQCLIKLLKPEKDAKYLLITHQWSKDQEKNFWWQANGLSFVEEILEKDYCLTEKMSFKSGKEAYRKIYFFDKNCYLE